MENNTLISMWKNPKLRENQEIIHPAGKGFQELSLSEMQYVAGGNGTVEPQATPATPATPLISKISVGLSAAGISYVGSFIASAAFDCKD